MKDTLEKEFPGIKIEMIKSKGGAFEIRHEGDLIYSKIETGEFPGDQLIVKTLRA